MKVHHIALRVNNLELMKAFYCQKLGFTEAFSILNDDGSVRIVYVHIADNQYLELCANGTTRPEFDDTSSVGFRHICFEVEDIQRTYDELTKQGVHCDSEILNMRDHNQAFYVFDPEHNKIEIVEIGPHSPQAAFRKRMVEDQKQV